MSEYCKLCGQDMKKHPSLDCWVCANAFCQWKKPAASIDTFRNQILCTDALTLCASLPPASVHCIVTSPPYFGLRDYGADGQIGLEDTPETYIDRLVTLFREARRALREDGTFWLNLGDTYTGGGRGGNPDESPYRKQATNAGSLITTRTNIDGLPPKNLLGIPWRVALALQADGWILRSDIIWHKPNPMPESVTDRPTKAHEYVFLFAKSPRYFYDSDAVREEAAYGEHHARYNSKQSGTSYNNKNVDNLAGNNGGLRGGLVNTDGRNKRSVWTVATQPYSEAHFATFPPKLIEPMIKAGCPKGGIVLDPFMGAGTTALVARRLGRDYIGSELSAEYCEMARKRIDQEDPTKPKQLPTGETQLSLFEGATV